MIKYSPYFDDTDEREYPKEDKNLACPFISGFSNACFLPIRCMRELCRFWDNKCKLEVKDEKNS